MAFLDDLAGGRYGVRVVPPPPLALVDHGDGWAHLQQPGLSWSYELKDVRFDLGVDLWPHLQRDLERQTRVMFERLSRSPTPRTATDPQWSTLLELERFELPGGAGVTVLHRTQYEPGQESITGRTLVPAAHGLFDASWVAATNQTGAREAALAIQAKLGGAGIPDQRFFDDPAHDARFPQHPLSIARGAKRWWAPDRLQLTAPQPIPHRGEIRLELLRCAITPPPRFLLQQLQPSSWGDCAYFTRVGLGVDGVETLAVARNHDRLPAELVPTRLASHGEQHARGLLMHHTDVTCSSVVAPPTGPHGEPRDPAVMILGEGTADGRRRKRLVWHWSIDHRQQVWSIGIMSSAAVPIRELLHDVDATRASLRQ